MGLRFSSPWCGTPLQLHPTYSRPLEPPSFLILDDDQMTERSKSSNTNNEPIRFVASNYKLIILANRWLKNFFIRIDCGNRWKLCSSYHVVIFKIIMWPTLMFVACSSAIKWFSVTRKSAYGVVAKACLTPLWTYCVVRLGNTSHVSVYTRKVVAKSFVSAECQLL